MKRILCTCSENRVRPGLSIPTAGQKDRGSRDENANSIYQEIMFCSCVMPSKCVLLQTIFRTCVTVTTLFCEKMADHFPELPGSDYGCVPLGWSGSGSVIQDHWDHDASKEPMNPWPEWIRRFLWCSTIRVILDTITELGYRKIFWFVSVSQINYWSDCHWQITKFFPTSST